MKNDNTKSKRSEENKVELFRVSPAEPLQIFRKERGIVADWDQVRWKDCLKLGLAIAGPVADIFGIDQSEIIYEEIHEIEDGYCRASVAFIAGVEQTQIESNKQKLDGAISSFLGYVYRENGRNLELFDGNLDQNDFETIVRKHATNFLQQNGGNKVGTPIQVDGASFTKICSGSFSHKPVVLPGKRIEKTFVGKVISMHCEKTEFLIKSESKDQATIAYNENSFFREIKELLGEPIIGTFAMHESMDPQGRIFLVLDSIDERRLDSGTLI